MFDALDPAVLSNKLSVKWSRHPDDVMEAWVADMDFAIAPSIKRAMQGVLDIDDLGYPGSDLRDAVRQAFVARMATRFGWQANFDDTWLLTTVVQGLHVAITIASERGEGVIVQTPIYPPFLAAIDKLNRRMVDAPLGRDGDRYVVDADLLAAAIDDNTRILLLCNPHNPTGRVFTDADLRAIAEVIEQHDIVVVADEVHQDLVYQGHTHRVFAAAAPELAHRTITLTAASKAFNLAGNRCALVHFGSKDLRERFEQLTHRLYGEVSIMGHVATLAAWTDPESQVWFDELLCYLDGNRRWLNDTIADLLPDARFAMPEATYLAWLDLSAYDLGDEPAEVLLTRGRVALGRGPDFGKRGIGHVRINFATSRSILEEVIERIHRCLDSKRIG